jgi:hypothetical protein
MAICTTNTILILLKAKPTNLFVGEFALFLNFLFDFQPLRYSQFDFEE